jgi:hypothetical protein
MNPCITPKSENLLHIGDIIRSVSSKVDSFCLYLAIVFLMQWSSRSRKCKDDYGLRGFKVVIFCY